jgi:hypothetical protein
MIHLEREYRDFLAKVGVGSNDKVQDSIYSYVSYLRTVSRLLNIDISPETVKDEDDVQNLYQRMYGKRSAKSISNYRSALRQYARMVQER